MLRLFSVLVALSTIAMPVRAEIVYRGTPHFLTAGPVGEDPVQQPPVPGDPVPDVEPVSGFVVDGKTRLGYGEGWNVTVRSRRSGERVLFVSGQLPSGISLTETGGVLSFSGRTPDGSYGPFRFEARTESGTVAGSEEIRVVVDVAAQEARFSPPSEESLLVGASGDWNLTFVPSGGIGPYRDFSVAGLPRGTSDVVRDGSVRITGRTKSGTFDKIAVFATDSVGKRFRSAPFTVVSMATTEASTTLPVGIATAGDVTFSTETDRSSLAKLLDNASFSSARLSGNGSAVTLRYAGPVRFDRMHVTAVPEGGPSVYELRIGGPTGSVVYTSQRIESRRSQTFSLPRQVVTQEITIVRLSESGSLVVEEFRPGAITGTLFLEEQFPIVDRTIGFEQFSASSVGWEDMHLEFRGSEPSLDVATRSGHQVVLGSKLMHDVRLDLRVRPQEGSELYQDFGILFRPTEASKLSASTTLPVGIATAGDVTFSTETDRSSLAKLMDANSATLATLSGDGSAVTLRYAEPVSFSAVNVVARWVSNTNATFEIRLGGPTGRRLAAGELTNLTTHVDRSFSLGRTVTTREISFVRIGGTGGIILSEFRPGNGTMRPPFPR